MANEDRELQALLVDYEQFRDDDRNFTSHIVQAFTIAIAILGLIGGSVAKIYIDTGELNALRKVPDPLLAGAPLLPLILFIYLLTMGPTAVLRTYYARHLERRISALASPRTGDDSRPEVYKKLSMPSLFEMTLGENRLSSGNSTSRILFGLMSILVVIIFSGLTAALLLSIEHGLLRALSIPFYAFAVVYLLWSAVAINTRGRELFERQLAILEMARQDGLTPQERAPIPGRGLASYLLLPRPGDLIKWLFFPVGALISFLASNGTPTELWRLVAMWFVLEYLLYGARYQINDIRGISEDRRAPAAGLRGRLPTTRTPFSSERDTQRSSIRASVFTVAIRIYLTLIIATLGGFDILVPTACAAIGITAFAVPYEWLRGIQRSAFNHSGSPQTTIEPRSRKASYAIIILVGSGYALRLILGLMFFAGPLPAYSFILYGVFAWSLGIVFVAITWALEGSAFLSKSPASNVRLTFNRDVLRKPHLLILALKIPWAKDRRYSISDSPPIIDRSDLHLVPELNLPTPLAPVVPSSLIAAPWAIAGTMAGTSAGVLFGVFLTSENAVKSSAIGFLFGLCTLGVFTLGFSSARTLRPTLILLAIAPLAITAYFFYRLDARLSVGVQIMGLSGVLGWVTLLGVIAAFSLQSYRDLIGFSASLKNLLTTVLRGIAKVVLGRDAAELLQPTLSPLRETADFGACPR